MDRPPRVYLWPLFLCQGDAPVRSLDVQLDLFNQRVVHSDVERTRNPNMTIEEKELAERLLTLYCKCEGISYKQGMNEVLAPFIFLARQGLPSTTVYQMFRKFLNTYLGTTYADEVVRRQEFRPLQAQLLVFRLLVRYHDPRFSAFLSNNGVGPELFATPWFLTLFSRCSTHSKISDIDIVFELWDTYLEEHDEFLSCYLGLAFIRYFRDFLMSKDSSEIPQALSQLTISNEQELADVLRIAKEIKNATPLSVEIQLSSFRIFDLQTVDEVIPRLEKLCCVSISPREVIQRCYPSQTSCSCPGETCTWCSKFDRNIKMVFVDCRPEDEQQQGTLQNLSLLDAKAYTEGSTSSDLLDQVLDLKDNVHICLMGMREFQHTKFALDIEEGEEEEESEPTDEGQAMLQDLLRYFFLMGFPYISVVDGGYEACHNLALSLSCELENHTSAMCAICHPELSVRRNLTRLRNRFVSDLQSALKSAKRTLVAWAAPKPTLEARSLEFIAPLTPSVERPKFFSYTCDKRTKEGKAVHSEHVQMTITPTELITCSLPDSLKQWKHVIELKWLSKITSKRNCAKALTFYFKPPSGEDQVLSFMFEDQSQAKLCVRQITAKFSSLPQVEAEVKTAEDAEQSD